MGGSKNIENLSKDDFDKICRTCLMQKKDMVIVNHNLEVIRMLHTCTRIKIGLDDRLPSHICYDCSYEVEKSFKFKQDCERHDRLLKRILKEYDERQQLSSQLVLVKEETANERSDKQNLKNEDDTIKEESSDENNDDDFSDLWKQDENDDFEDDNEEKDQKNGSYVDPSYNVETVINPEEKEDRLKSENSNNSKNDHLILNIKSCTVGGSNTNKEVPKKPALYFDPEKCDEKTRTCKICNKALVNIYSLARHMEMHNENRKFAHTCKVCSKGFYELGHLTKHMRRHEGNKRYFCEICNKGFYELSAQAVHMKKHKVKPMPCDICGKKFLVKLQLEIHKKSHEEFKHFCPDCGKGFPALRLLKKHSVVHNKEKPFMCLECNGFFKHESTLRKHIKTIHEGIKERDVCNVCGKSVSCLKYHMFKHYGGEKRFKCNECTLAFHLNSQLTQHVLQKHRGEKRSCTALCTICGKECHSPRDLEIHMRKHTGEKPLACTSCDKKYKTPSALQVHMRSHTNERPYICSICGKGFFTSTVLKNHIRIHTGERPFVCQLCQRAFTQKVALKTHMKTH